MKKAGVLHPELAHALASLGHGDTIVIADAGLPVPAGVPRIDLAFYPGKPRFLDVLEAVLSEMQVEAVTLASEVQHMTPKEVYEALIDRLPIPAEHIRYLPHEAFKEVTQKAKAIVRTGELTPYANVILASGVIF